MIDVSKEYLKVGETQWGLINTESSKSLWYNSFLFYLILYSTVLFVLSREKDMYNICPQCVFSVMYIFYFYSTGARLLHMWCWRFLASCSSTWGAAGVPCLRPSLTGTARLQHQHAVPVLGHLQCCRPECTEWAHQTCECAAEIHWWLFSQSTVLP